MPPDYPRLFADAKRDYWPDTKSDLEAVVKSSWKDYIKPSSRFSIALSKTSFTKALSQFFGKAFWGTGRFFFRTFVWMPFRVIKRTVLIGWYRLHV